jgi:hypothetical protein
MDAFQPQPVDRLDQAILAFAAKWSLPPTNRRPSSSNAFARIKVRA